MKLRLFTGDPSRAWTVKTIGVDVQLNGHYVATLWGEDAELSALGAELRLRPQSPHFLEYNVLRPEVVVK